MSGAPIITQGGTPGATPYSYYIVIAGTNGTNSASGFGGTYTGNATLSGTNFNTISCSILPTGTTGTVYNYTNTFKFRQVSTAGACTGPSASVNDIGVYGASVGNTFYSAGADMNVGRIVVNGMGGSIAWTQQSNFTVGTTSPITISQDISAPSTGVFSFDTTTKGNGLGVIHAAGGTFTGETTVPTPTNTGDAATKGYVDSHTTSGFSGTCAPTTTITFVNGIATGCS